MPLHKPSATDCIFIGGPFHDQVFKINDQADGVYVAESGVPIAALGSVGGMPPDYQRTDSESTAFAHSSCTSDDIDAFFGFDEDDVADDKPNNSAMLDYIAGARDFANAVLQRFACANCNQPAFSFN